MTEPVLLVFDFAMDGAGGAERAAALRALAAEIATYPGLLWKIWTEDAAAGRAGGIYLFANAASADAYRAMHTARLRARGVTGPIDCLARGINAELTAITRGPVPAQD